MKLFAGIEAGGTKFVLGVGTAEGGSIATGRIETRDPASTVADVAAFFAQHKPADGYAGLGIATFGPVDLDRASPRYGHILATPKPGWRNFDLAGTVGNALGLEAALDTDVNGAAIAEAAAWGEGDLAYATVGTGIGVGLVVNGRPVHGKGHPEVGHILIRRHADHAGFKGVCPYHGDCLEGLAAGPAIKAAWGTSLDRLPHDHPAFAAEADYLAQLCVTLILTVSAPRIVLGGGVMAQESLFPLIRARTAALLAGYVAATDAADLVTRIVPPRSIEPPGLLGAYRLAAEKAHFTSKLPT